jgi:hypothetical protein
VTKSDSEILNIVCKIYGDGDFSGGADVYNGGAEHCGDTLFQFLMSELSVSTECCDFDEAIQRVSTTIRELEQVRPALLQRAAFYGISNLRHDNFSSLARSLGKLRLKREFGGKLPRNGMLPCIPELPVAYLETVDTPVVKGVNLPQVSLGDWLTALIERRFRWDNGAWMIA